MQEGIRALLEQLDDDSVIEVVSGALDYLNNQKLWRISDPGLLTGTRSLLQAAERLRAESSRRIAEIDFRGATTARFGVRTSEWLQQTNWTTAPGARRQVKTAVALKERPGVQAAVLAGQVGFDQATAIVDSIGRLPCELDRDTIDQCEQEMLAHAHEFDPDMMKQFGHGVVAVVAPEVGEVADRLALLREEARARGDRSFTWSRDGFGSVRFRGQLPIIDAEPLVALVSAVASSMPSTDEFGELVPIHRRQADALTHIAASYAATNNVPTQGGERPRVIVTISLDALKTGLGMGTLCSSGEAVSAGNIRRLACDADIIPVVLNGQSRILDMGRASRLFDGPTRQALVLRDQGCVFPGCNAPAVVCEGHHITPWWEGGRTDLANAALLCPYHHRIVEPRPTDRHNQWQVQISTDGVPEFLPPRFVDKHRTPRRHQRFLLKPSQPTLELEAPPGEYAKQNDWPRKAESESVERWQFEKDRAHQQAIQWATDEPRRQEQWREECLAGNNPWHPPESLQTP